MSDSDSHSLTSASAQTTGKNGEPEVLDAVKKLAENKPTEFHEIMMAMQMGPVGNPVLQKVTKEHLTQVLDLAHKHDEREYDLLKESQGHDQENARSNRRYFFAGFVIIVVLTTIILFLFQDKTDVLFPVLSGLGGLVGGFVAGFGFGSRKRE